MMVIKYTSVKHATRRQSRDNRRAWQGVVMGTTVKYMVVGLMMGNADPQCNWDDTLGPMLAVFIE